MLARAGVLASIAVALHAATATPLPAQCPDGTPPPCRAALLAPRRAATIDERAWLILPFANTSGAADAAMLSQASVNLLYQNLARWQDMRVVSDDRVADLLRALPASERERPGLQSGLTLARQVGAGRLVLGDFLALGGQAQINAKVYDVRSGRQLRLVREQLTSLNSLDSLTVGFGRLARGVLAVEAGAGENAGVGTTSLEAYREYVAGMRALNRIELDTAVARFRRAIALDSAFALAHLRLFEAIPDFSAEAVAESQRQLAVALRFAAALPPRERMLVNAHAAEERRDYDQLCRAARDLVRADSSDAEAWTLLSACRADTRLVVPPGDSAIATTRGDLGGAIGAARRAAALAPGSVFELTLMNLLGMRVLHLCPGDAGPAACPPREHYVGALWVTADTARLELRRWSDVHAAPPYLTPEAVANHVQRLKDARDILDRFRAQSPNNRLLDAAMGRFDVALGDTAGAMRLFAAFTQPGDTLARAVLEQRFLLALQRRRIAEAASLVDSVVARSSGNAPYLSMFGRFVEGADSTPALRQNARWRQILAGVLPAGFDTLETRIAERLTGEQREDFLQLSTLAAFRMRHAGPALDTAAAHPLKRYQAWFARGDTARARAALAQFDRDLLARHEATPDDGGWLFSAEAHLDLGDSTVAEERLAAFERRWPFAILDATILDQWYWQRGGARLFGRAWLLHGDLAAARGRSEVARRAYTVVLGLWEHGEAPVQPIVTRVRAALAQ